MGIKKFIDNVKESLDVELVKDNTKKKSLKILLNKLEKRKEKLEKSIKSKKSQDSNEELEIVILHIKKGNKILNKLNLSKTNSNKDTKG